MLLAGLGLALTATFWAGEALSLPPSTALMPSLLGSRTGPPLGLDVLPRWRDALARIEAERPLYRACDEQGAACRDPALRRWRDLLRRLAGQPLSVQLDEVNRFANAWPYRTDAENFGRSDYWASPLEFLARSGDCEDYAIIKYVSLRELGVADRQLRLVVLRDTLRGDAHAVLAVAAGDHVWILDNLAETVLPQDQLSHYRPYYSVNAQSRWMHASLPAGAAARGKGER